MNEIPGVFGSAPFLGDIQGSFMDTSTAGNSIASNRSFSDTTRLDFRSSDESAKYEIPDSSNDKKKNMTINFSVTIPTIIISSLIFLTIFAWYDLLVALFAETFGETVTPGNDPGTIRLWFAIFISALTVIIIYIIYRIVNMDQY